MDDLHEEGNLNDVFTRDVDEFVRQSLGHLWALKPQVDLIDITFHAEALSFIQKRERNDLHKNRKNLTQANQSIENQE